MRLGNRLMNKRLLFDKMQKEAPDYSGALKFTGGCFLIVVIYYFFGFPLTFDYI